MQSSNLGLLSDLCVDSKVQGFPGNSLTLVFKCFRPWHDQQGHSFWL